MSDLISRSELLTSFNKKNIQITFDLPVEEVLGEDVDLDDFAMLVQDAIQSYKKMVIDTIENQPTAYDIDKDDVCEWRKRKEEWESQCDYYIEEKWFPIMFQTTLDEYYCPYCGKKIKVVE